MILQLIIRHNLEGHEATFQPGDLRSFEETRVRLGTGTECECALPAASGLPALLAVIETRPASDGWTVTAAPGVPVFLNHQPLTDAQPLRSGDEIRCGHWTFRAYKAPPAARRAARADRIATFAKILVGVILTAEVLLLSWLPRQIQRAELWQREILRQRLLMQTDELRKRVRDTAFTTPLQRAAQRLLADQVEAYTGWLRRHQDRMSAAELNRAADDVRSYEDMLAQMQSGHMFPSPVTIDLDAAVKALLRRADPKAPSP